MNDEEEVELRRPSFQFRIFLVMAQISADSVFPACKNTHFLPDHITIDRSPSLHLICQLSGYNFIASFLLSVYCIRKIMEEVAKSCVVRLACVPEQVNIPVSMVEKGIGEAHNVSFPYLVID